MQPSQKPPSLLILAHKCDLIKAGQSTATSTAEQLAISRVRTILERELEKRRLSQTTSIGIKGLGEKSGERETELGGLECSGSSGGVFKFAEWQGGEVTFLGSYVVVGKALGVEEEKGEGKGLFELIRWIEKLR